MNVFVIHLRICCDQHTMSTMRHCMRSFAYIELINFYGFIFNTFTLYTKVPYNSICTNEFLGHFSIHFLHFPTSSSLFFCKISMLAIYICCNAPSPRLRCFKSFHHLVEERKKNVNCIP